MCIDFSSIESEILRRWVYRSTRELTLSIHSTGNSHRGFRRASGWHFRRVAAHTTRGHARCGHDVPPFLAVKVTGALFHTQGGLAIDAVGRVRRKDGTGFPNLFAAGGAAAGVSGGSAAGYLSGNGLLTASVLGRLAGRAAATQASH